MLASNVTKKKLKDRRKNVRTRKRRIGLIVFLKSDNDSSIIDVGQVKILDRCKLFSKLTRSSDVNCSLFEELLENFFEEYNTLYGAMDKSGVVDDIANISCLEDNNSLFKVEAVFENVVAVDDKLIDNLTSFLASRLKRTHDVKIDKINSDTILITLVKKG